MYATSPRKFQRTAGVLQRFEERGVAMHKDLEELVFGEVIITKRGGSSSSKKKKRREDGP